MRSSRLLSVAVVSLVACGDDGGDSTPDAPVGSDAPIDAPRVITGCDYVEQSDTTNDDFSGGTAEETALTFAGETVVCGWIDPGHFDAGSAGAPGIPDIDSFVVTLSAPSSLLVTLSGTGIEALGLVEVNVYGGNQLQDFIVSGDFVGTHAVASLTLPAGRYGFSMLSENATALTTAIQYKIKIVSDSPTTRCPRLTGPATYTESLDTGTSRGNDVVKIDYSADIEQSLTTDGADAPEPSGITTSTTMSYRISGSSAVIAPDAQYKDRDTFAFATGATTNQLSVRLNWPDAADLDWYVFEAGVIPGYVGRSVTTATAEDEFKTFAVKPSTNYWVWVGGDAANTTTVPTAYDLAVCGGQFVP